MSSTSWSAGALSGEPMLAVVEGPAGIGKSRLLEAAREKASDAGSRVLSARGSDLERELPFGIVRQLFEPVLSDPDQRRRWLGGPALPAARAFAPPDDGDVAGDVSFGILYGLFWLIANIAADGPLSLSVDDLHWCDTASVRFITYLEPRLRGLRVFVATATRIGQPNAESRLIGEIAHAPTAVSIRPDALSAQGVDALVRERLGRSAEPAFSAACRRATGGNPLLLHELLKTLRTEHVPFRMRRTPTRSATSARVRCPTASCYGWGGCLAKRPRSRAPWRCSAPGPACRSSPRWPSSTTNARRRRPGC